MLPALALGACGGGERQDEDEPEGDFKVEIIEATFPAQQALAKQHTFTLTVRNADDKDIPNVAVSVDSFDRRSERTDLSDPNRPVWIVDTGPRGGTTAYTNTWALGKLGTAETKTFTWRVTPILAGVHTVRWEIVGGLDGKAKLQLAQGGGKAKGAFTIEVAGDPAQAHVDPDSGKVVREKPGSSAESE